MQRRKYMPCAFLAFFLLTLGYLDANGQAQGTIKVEIKTLRLIDLTRNEAMPRVKVDIGGYTTTTDDRGRGSIMVAPGDHTARVIGPCPLDSVSLIGSVRQVGHPKQPILQFPDPSNQTPTVTFLMRCEIDPLPGLVRVKIATRTSCTDDPNGAVNVQSGVRVMLGDKTYTSDENGVIEADLPAGTYPVNASWQDYAFAFVAQNGLKLPKDESGRSSITISDRVETLEVRMLTCDEGGRERARAVINEIESIQGISNIKVTRSNAEGRGFVGMQLRDGDLVVIQGKAKLKWLDGNGVISFDSPSNIIRIGPGTAPAGSTRPAGRSTLELLKGLGNFFIPADDSDYDPADFDENGNRIRFRGSTHGVNVGVKGTVFSLGYDDQREVTTVIVHEGVVAVTPKYPGQRPFELRAGQRAEISPSGVKSPDVSTAQSGPTIKTAKPVYAPSERIEVEYSHPAGHEWDLITIAKPTDGDQSSVGSPSGVKTWESSTGKQRSGSKSFEGLAAGQFEARYVSWDGGNNRVTARVSFTVGKIAASQPPVTGNPPWVSENTGDLSGLWIDDTRRGGIYRLRQIGDKLYWSVDAVSKQSFANVYLGEIRGDIISGEWIDMPGSPTLSGGRMMLRIQSNCKLVKMSSSTHYGAQSWTKQGSSCDVTGMVQRVIPKGAEKPKVEEIRDDTAVVTTQKPNREDKPSDRQKTDEDEEIPDDEVVTAQKPNRDDRSVDEDEEIPDDDAVATNDPRRSGQGIGQGNPPMIYPPPKGGLWTLASVSVSPETPSRTGGFTWSYSKEGSTAHMALYNGDQASFQWTIPPRQFDGNGFSVTIAAQGNPSPNNQIGVIIGVSGHGLTADTNQPSVNVTAVNRSAGDQKTVRFVPVANANEIEVRVAFQWAVTYIYKYRRAQ